MSYNLCGTQVAVTSPNLSYTPLFDVVQVVCLFSAVIKGTGIWAENCVVFCFLVFLKCFTCCIDGLLILVGISRTECLLWHVAPGETHRSSSQIIQVGSESLYLIILHCKLIRVMVWASYIKVFSQSGIEECTVPSILLSRLFNIRKNCNPHVPSLSYLIYFSYIYIFKYSFLS